MPPAYSTESRASWSRRRTPKPDAPRGRVGCGEREHHDYELYRVEMKYEITIAELGLQIKRLLARETGEFQAELRNEILKLRRSMMGRG